LSASERRRLAGELPASNSTVRSARFVDPFDRLAASVGLLEADEENVNKVALTNSAVDRRA